MTEYISQKGANTLRNFKYKGGSIAVSYQHLWSPLAQKIVSYIPRTIAPNLITVIGTIIHIIGNMALIVQEKGKLSIPLSLLFFGICVFVYYTIDNVDGKQARRTHTSSPLGMCMDHGCDVLGVSFIALGVSRMIVLDDDVTLLFTSQIAVLGTFWMSVWAQYHSKGILVLGKINAVDDGIPAVAFMGIGTFIFGQQIWLKPIFGSFLMQYGLVAFIWIAGIAQIFGLVFESGDNFTNDLKGALYQILHYPFLALSLFSVVYFTNWEHEYFFAIYFTTALIIVRDTSYMHVCVVAEDKYNQWQLPTLVYIVGYPLLSAFCYFTNASPLVQAACVYGMLLVSVYNYFSYVTKVSRQMANILGIRIFHIKPIESQKSQ